MRRAKQDSLEMQSLQVDAQLYFCAQQGIKCLCKCTSLKHCSSRQRSDPISHWLYWGWEGPGWGLNLLGMLGVLGWLETLCSVVMGEGQMGALPGRVLRGA